MSLDNIEKALELGLKLDTLSYQQSQAEYQECDRRAAKLDSEIKVIRSQIKQALADLKAYRERLESGTAKKIMEYDSCGYTVNVES